MQPRKLNYKLYQSTIFVKFSIEIKTYILYLLIIPILYRILNFLHFAMASFPKTEKYIRLHDIY